MTNRLHGITRPFTLLLLSTSMLLSTKTAHAQSNLYNTFAPGDAFDSGSYASVANDPEEEFYSAYAIQFTLSAGDDYTFSDAILAMNGDGGTFKISLALDNAGAPGTFLESISQTVSTTGLYTFTSLLNPVLTAGSSYWIVATADSGAIGGWNDPTPDDSANSVFSSDASNWTTDGTARGLRVEGFAVAIPEPGTIALAGLGLGLAVMFKRRNSRNTPNLKV